MIVVPAIGTGIFMEALRIAMAVAPPVLRLFQNDEIPSLGDDVGDYMECTFPGYAAVSLSGGHGVISLDPPSYQIQFDPVTFTRNSSAGDPQRAFGYYVVTPIIAHVLWAERLPYRKFMRAAGDTLVINPAIGGFSEFTG